MKSLVLRLLLTALARTWRITVVGAMPTVPSVVAFWHGEMLPVWYLFGRTCPLPVLGLVSASNDGAILTDLLEFWGLQVVRGSSSKGGSEALKELVLAAGDHALLITPDGPRGPRQTFKPGAVLAASRAGVPLRLLRVDAPTSRTFTKSWDHFTLPIPFARIQVFLSEEIRIGSDSDRDYIDGVIEQMQRRMTANPEHVVMHT